MAVMGPSENPAAVEAAYQEIMTLLKNKYNIQNEPAASLFPGGAKTWAEDREERNAAFREALRLLFQLDSWENF